MNSTRIRQERRLILQTWLIAGTLDILLAFLYSYTRNNAVTPPVVLSYIYRVGFRGATADQGIMIISGLVLHFLIALVWTFIYFKACPKNAILWRNMWLSAVIYGIFIWGMMNLIILPLWTGKPIQFDPAGALANAIILIIAFGLPLSYFIGGWFRKRKIRL